MNYGREMKAINVLEFLVSETTRSFDDEYVDFVKAMLSGWYCVGSIEQKEIEACPPTPHIYIYSWLIGEKLFPGFS